MPDPLSAQVVGSLDEMFITKFNRDLDALSSSARVALPNTNLAEDMIELQDDEGNLVGFIPSGTSPRMAAIAYRLYGQAFKRGVRAGEDAAWAKLRHLIGAASTER